MTPVVGYILGAFGSVSLALAAWFEHGLRRARLERDMARVQAATWQAIAEGRAALVAMAEAEAAALCLGAQAVAEAERAG